MTGPWITPRAPTAATLPAAAGIAPAAVIIVA